ncbi:hypothetical protein K7X08_037805 [Anisodus acutangulus]|uniref:Uncharacterized protein n=2 Tax=Anisodus TaxID=243963 RepID=A0A9Q1N1K9_9SOLA|nr:hypothetical protein K7X08_037805 [Anisodus acutangulus]
MGKNINGSCHGTTILVGSELMNKPPSTFRPPTLKFYGKHMYSQEELDDIRVEWGLHFSKILAETKVRKLNADE